MLRSKSLSIGLLLLVLLCAPGQAQKPSYNTAVKQREALLGELRAELANLPALNETVTILESQLQALESGKKPPKKTLPRVDSPRKLSTVQPVSYADYKPKQQSELQALDGEIQQLQAMMPVLEERRARITKLNEQIALAKSRK